MNNIEIMRLLKRHPVTRSVFVGVYASDTLPHHPRWRRPCAYIANTDPISQPGEHWVAFFFGKMNVEYFDSFGNRPLPPFQDFMNTWDYDMNNLQIQSSLANTCGQHCIYYIWNRCKGLEKQNIIDSFNKDNLLANDISVNDSIERHFGSDLDIINPSFLASQISQFGRKNTLVIDNRAKISAYQQWKI